MTRLNIAPVNSPMGQDYQLLPIQVRGDAVQWQRVKNLVTFNQTFTSPSLTPMSCLQEPEVPSNSAATAEQMARRDLKAIAAERSYGARNAQAFKEMADAVQERRPFQSSRGERVTRRVIMEQVTKDVEVKYNQEQQIHTRNRRTADRDDRQFIDADSWLIPDINDPNRFVQLSHHFSQLSLEDHFVPREELPLYVPLPGDGMFPIEELNFYIPQYISDVTNNLDHSQHRYTDYLNDQSL
ncbi:hypothetical protein SISNIDRAFT_482407 [Sistotremastrum niveocremeum HHB9708]|uniref:Uncharacterized protein n=1 Tax=Sistotremastrum niveocremeum HHB9708 TaxID=1314777 RepID=A0A164Y5V6_9AGAM|nr:hypothetical protein SISNIDRAFT_482407 [Sistotremastrum niveocremeum HHB9708]